MMNVYTVLGEVKKVTKRNSMTKTTEGQTPKALEIHQIYDSIFKTALTLSPQAVIRFINSLYDMDYSTDSTIIYNWTESHDRRLKRTLSDTIITVNYRDGKGR